jgi:hypothetical protein
MINKPIFQRSDFQLCDVPVPEGYPQSQTHAGVFLYDGVFYMTTSPYPNKRYSRWKSLCRIALRKLSCGLFNEVDGEYYENPCLYKGETTNVSDIPVRFKPLADNPLVRTPESLNGLPAYNSDPDLFVEDGTFYILNRTLYRTKMLEHGYESRTIVSLIAGELRDDSFVHIGTRQIKEWNLPFTSPCLTKYRGKYVFSFLDTNSAIDSSTFNGIFFQSVNSIEDLSIDNQYVKIDVDSDVMLPWHMSLFQYKGTLYTVIACVRKGDPERKIWQMLGTFSEDLTELKVFPVPLSDYNSYRGSACVREDGLFILYNTTVCEQVVGSDSIDGRDVILAFKPFDDLIKEVRGL